MDQERKMKTPGKCCKKSFRKMAEDGVCVRGLYCKYRVFYKATGKKTEFKVDVLHHFR